MNARRTSTTEAGERVYLDAWKETEKWRCIVQNICEDVNNKLAILYIFILIKWQNSNVFFLRYLKISDSYCYIV